MTLETIREEYKQALIRKKSAELSLSLGPHGHFENSFCFQNAMWKIEDEAEVETLEMEWKLLLKPTEKSFKEKVRDIITEIDKCNLDDYHGVAEIMKLLKE